MAETFRRWFLPALLIIVAMLLEDWLGAGLIWGYFAGLAAVTFHPETPHIISMFTKEKN